MSGLSLVPIHDAITAYVESLLPNTPVEEDTLPDEMVIPRDEFGQMKPYVILRYGPIRRTPGRSGSLRGPRHDDYYGTMDLMTCAPTGRMARQLFDILTDRLMAFEPAGTGPITLEGAASNFVVNANEVRPIQKVCMVRLRFPANSTNVGEYIPAP
jgi:hypothetical protein